MTATPFAGKKWAIGLGTALLLAFGLTIAAGFRDAARISTLEKIDEPSAVGDHAFFPRPDKISPEKPVLSLGGQPLIALDTAKGRDGLMLKAGMDDSNSFFVYRARVPKKDEQDLYFLKLADGQYLKVRRGTK